MIENKTTFQYEPYSIVNDGEVALHQILEKTIRYHKESWTVFHSFRIVKHRTQKMGECDFLILNKHGLIVIEVKGKQIGFEQGRFFYANDSPYQKQTWFDKDPFLQVDDNVGSLIDHIKEKKIRNCFVTGVVVFPQSTFDYKGVSYKNFWHLGSKDDFITFLLNCQDETREKSGWSDTVLSKNDQERILTALAPTVMPNQVFTNLRLSREEALRKVEHNISVLEGLYENKRLMIQGPPGSGKSKYARKIVNRKILDENKKGLYICWNEFLATKMNYEFEKDGLSQHIHAWPLFRFLQHLIESSGQPRNTLTFQNMDAISDILMDTFGLLESQSLVHYYDFIILDEAQDLFDKGIDIIINRMLNNGKNGLERGEYIIFYDTIQAFGSDVSRESYDFNLSYFKENAAIYKLKESYRAVASEGLHQLITELQTGDLDFEKNYGNDVKFYQYKNYDEIPRILEKIRNQLLNVAKCTPADIMILCTSNLISRDGGMSKPLDKSLHENAFFVKMTSENLMDNDDQIKYTTALRFKGLDREVIVIIVDDLYNDKIDTLYQVFIGVTRAKSKVYMITNQQ